MAKHIFEKAGKVMGNRSAHGRNDTAEHVSHGSDSKPFKSKVSSSMVKNGTKGVFTNPQK